jgi:flagellin-like protein
MRRLYKNKKAVSPVIATVLMILVVMAGMTLLFAFVGAYAQNFQAGTGSSVLESLSVEDVWFNGNTAQVWVLNIGKVDTKINSVYVNGTMAVFTAEPASVASGGHSKIIVTSLFAGDGNSYTLKIVTERGSAFEGTYLR